MKKNYEEPVMVVQKLVQEDIIVTSPNVDYGDVDNAFGS